MHIYKIILEWSVSRADVTTWIRVNNARNWRVSHMCEIVFYLSVNNKYIPFLKEQQREELMMVEVWTVLPLCLMSCLLHTLKSFVLRHTLYLHALHTNTTLNQSNTFLTYVSGIKLSTNDIIISIQFNISCFIFCRTPIPHLMYSIL